MRFVASFSEDSPPAGLAQDGATLGELRAALRLVPCAAACQPPVLTARRWRR